MARAMLDLNRNVIANSPLNVQLNELLDRHATPRDEAERHYLGASFIGSDCLRQIQYDWQVEAEHPVRLRDIFDRGHFFEEVARQRMKAAGFAFRPHGLGFSAADGMFQGHGDGIIDDGPALPGVAYPCLWEHKALGQSGWRAIERDGLVKAYPKYAAQVSIYQAYLDVADNAAIFTITNANDCTRLHVLVPFDATRAQLWSDRAVGIIKATMRGELLPRVAKLPDDWRCKMCSHRTRCWPLSN
jgi:hypothetical protein